MLLRLKNTMRPLYRAIRRSVLDKGDWKARGYASPSPTAIKHKVLKRNGYPAAAWVETGTFLGETTVLLAREAKQVYSLEPATEFYVRAQNKFSSWENVSVINGPSETVLPTLLPNLTGPVNFWLDGHYSAGQTFKGRKDTPIIEELSEIELNIAKLKPICVLIDDVRCFDPSKSEYSSYPSIDYLVDWARKNGLKWHIEHDIFVAKSPA